MDPKRTAKFDAWDSNSIKTLEDLFNFESKQLDLMQKKRIQIATATNAALKAQYRNELRELENDYIKIITNVRKEAEETIKDQHKRRMEYFQEEYEEYSEFLKLLKSQGQISDKQQKSQLKALAKAQNIEEQNFNKRKKMEGKEQLARARQERKSIRDSVLESSKHVWGGVGSVGTQITASLSKVGENLGKSIGKAFNDMSNKINSMMDTYAKYQSSMDARLQGSEKNFTAMQAALKSAVGASPYLKTETMLNNLQSLVEAGIVTNVEQRAFLNTIKDKVAQTFDASNAALLRIIRIQQRDSTAARLGMEAYLTAMFNQWMENTEYLTTTFDGVQEALLEASSIMTTAASTEFEFIVQKWLGSLVGRGMSNTTATSLAGALGMLGSGNVTGLSGNALNNLLVMAASRAGLDYGDILSGGLTAQTTNQLMQALVGYMQEINSSSSNVVRSQLAQTFGLTVSDLMSASGLASSMEEVANTFMTYNEMYTELADQLNQVSSRTHIAEKLTNLFDNAQFSLASTIAGNAVMSAMWKVTDMIQGYTGGINIPMISVVGNAVDLETTVENLMKLGLIGIGSLGMIGDVVTGLSQAGGGFSKVLNSLGIKFDENANKYAYSFRTQSTGNGLRLKGPLRRGGLGTSETVSLISTTSGEDIAGQTLNTAMDEQNQKQAEAAAGQDNPMDDLRTYFLDVFDIKFSNLLAMVARNGGYSEYANPAGEQPVMIGDRSIIRTTYTVKGEESAGLLSNIENSVNNIVDILTNKIIKVSIENVGTVPGENYAGLQ